MCLDLSFDTGASGGSVTVSLGPTGLVTTDWSTRRLLSPVKDPVNLVPDSRKLVPSDQFPSSYYGSRSDLLFYPDRGLDYRYRRPTVRDRTQCLRVKLSSVGSWSPKTRKFLDFLIDPT